MVSFLGKKAPRRAKTSHSKKALCFFQQKEIKLGGALRPKAPGKCGSDNDSV